METPLQAITCDECEKWAPLLDSEELQSRFLCVECLEQFQKEVQASLDQAPRSS